MKINFIIVSLILNLGLLFFKLPAKEPLPVKMKEPGKIVIKMAPAPSVKAAAETQRVPEEQTVETTAEEPEPVPESVPEPVLEPIPAPTPKPKPEPEKKKPVKEQVAQKKKDVKQKTESKKVQQEKLPDNITIGTDGNYVAASSEGIEFQIIKSPEPEYPLMAKKARFRNKVAVKVKFLVGINGEIERVEILEGPKKFGFEQTVLKAVSQWKFKPIKYQGRNIKVYFYKEFKFESI